MKKLSRRNFLQTGCAGAAGIMASNGLISPVNNSSAGTIYRTLGKTGLKIPVVSMGVMIADSPSLVRAALDKGIKLFDTANGYQNGKNEEMLGNVLKDYPRDSFYIATKVAPSGVDMITGKPTKETTEKDFLEKFDVSLKRLGMKHVDILYMHKAMSPEMVNYKPIVKAMQNLRKQGKVKFIGISTHNLPKIIDAITATDTWDVVLTTYNFLNTELIRARSEAPVYNMDAAIHQAAQAGLGVVGMKALAGGGFFDKEKTRPINASAAIKWVLSNPDVHTVIPGMTTFDQLEIDSKLLTDITLTEGERNDLAAAGKEAGLYCTACSNCVPGCRMNLPIPEIMRAYMYAYGYSSSDLAWRVLADAAAVNNPCKDCNECTATCVKNFDLKKKITDITRLSIVPPEFLRGSYS